MTSRWLAVGLNLSVFVPIGVQGQVRAGLAAELIDFRQTRLKGC